MNYDFVKNWAVLPDGKKLDKNVFDREMLAVSMFELIGFEETLFHSALNSSIYSFDPQSNEKEFLKMCEKVALESHTSNYEGVFMPTKQANKLIKGFQPDEKLHELRTEMDDILLKSFQVIFDDVELEKDKQKWRVD